MTWQVHLPGSVRICDGQHDSVEGCAPIGEAEIIHIARADAEANARLMAAAPELLQVLEELWLAVAQVTVDDPTRYAVANAVGLPALKAHQLIRRLKR